MDEFGRVTKGLGNYIEYYLELWKKWMYGIQLVFMSGHVSGWVCKRRVEPDEGGKKVGGVLKHLWKEKVDL